MLFKSLAFQTFVPLSSGLGLVAATLGKRKKRALRSPFTYDKETLDHAKVMLEFNIDTIIEKINAMDYDTS